jgi:hypothetical protein
MADKPRQPDQHPILNAPIPGEYKIDPTFMGDLNKGFPLGTQFSPNAESVLPKTNVQARLFEDFLRKVRERK